MLIVGGLAVKFVDREYPSDYEFFLDPIFKFLEKSESKMIQNNGFRALAKLFTKLDLHFITIEIKKTMGFLSKFIANENEVDNLKNALTCFHYFISSINMSSLEIMEIKNNGCLAKMISLMR